MIINIKFRFSLSGDADVTDEHENDLYKVKGKVFSFFRTKKLYSLSGEKIYTIRNKFFRFPFTRSAIIKDKDGRIAKVSNLFSAKHFEVNTKNDDYTVEGRLIDPFFTIYKNGREAARGRIVFSLYGSYEIDVSNPEDYSFMVALLIAFNNINKSKK